MQPDLLHQEKRLYDRLCEPEMLYHGFAEVRRNKGAPGIDKVTVSDFESNLEQELARLSEELTNWCYKPKPVRRAEIPKPGTTEKRKLGIPCIRDRVVDSTLKQLLEPILVPNFSMHSYGFIPGKGQHDAILAAQRIVQSGKETVVDIDLSKFFDRISHDRLIHRLGTQIPDKRILRLIGMKLRSGIMKEGLVSSTTEGAIQGSPLSPLLSNVVLDELDKELERRNLAFCRYADDCNIFVKTRKAGERVMGSITRFIEGKLKLQVNQRKSQVAPSEQVRFLGMTIVKGTVSISKESINRAMEKVKALTPRGTRETLEATMERINRWYKGWSGYYSLTQYPSQLVKIEAHVRRRLRSRLVDQQKSRKNLYNKLRKRGVSHKSAAKWVFTNDKRWVLSNRRCLTKAYPVLLFTVELGQYIRSTQRLPHWFDLKKWIRLV